MKYPIVEGFFLILVTGFDSLSTGMIYSFAPFVYKHSLAYTKLNKCLTVNNLIKL